MDAILQELLDFTSGVIASEKGVKEFLKALDLQVALEYLQGSVIMFRGSITAKTKKTTQPHHHNKDLFLLHNLQLLYNADYPK